MSTHNLCFEQNMKNFSIFYLKLYFYSRENRSTLQRGVIVMRNANSVDTDQAAPLRAV